MMTKAEAVGSPPEGKALVTFLRPSALAKSSQVAIWDDERFVGMLLARTYVQYVAEPGEHVFMAVGFNKAYLKATLQAGKTYYVIGRVHPGAAGRVSVVLDPVTKADYANPVETANLAKWMKAIRPMAATPAMAEAYQERRLAQARQRLDEHERGVATHTVLEAEDAQ